VLWLAEGVYSDLSRPLNEFLAAAAAAAAAASVHLLQRTGISWFR